MKLNIFFLVGLVLSKTTIAVAEIHTILQKDKKFSTETVTIKLGDTLVFKNGEKDITHNVYSITQGNEFELKVQKPGTSTPVVVDSKTHLPGEMLVECAIHPNMKLKVKIEK